MIELESLGKMYSGVWALKGVDLRVPAGEVFGMLGPNGAGKTTAIRLMAGLLKPTEGRVLISGYDINKSPAEAKSRFGYVPDRQNLYDKLKVSELFAFVASVYGMQRLEADLKIRQLSELFGVDEILNYLIEGCSQGMRQRILFVTALLHGPKALIIDEPFVGLDPFGVLLVKDLINKLKDDGMTVFLATHSLHIAQNLCSRVGIINRGKLISILGKSEFEHGLERAFMDAVGRGHEQP